MNSPEEAARRGAWHRRRAAKNADTGSDDIGKCGCAETGSSDKGRTHGDKSPPRAAKVPADARRRGVPRQRPWRAAALERVTSSEGGRTDDGKRLMAASDGNGATAANDSRSGRLAQAARRSSRPACRAARAAERERPGADERLDD
ncbi:hypothetical protein PI859_23005 [Burkholderia pseudomallei]|uniref:hypothetical protein n=1 Tax=Burkholderia TaxID=32008 RepID=UPI0010FA6BD8|nr:MULTISPECIES: hypothetical protein [Burkholderia]MDA5592945.1 hypothetical protein [Burkholderia pseudomallei]